MDSQFHSPAGGGGGGGGGGGASEIDGVCVCIGRG